MPVLRRVVSAVLAAVFLVAFAGVAVAEITSYPMVSDGTVRWDFTDSVSGAQVEGASIFPRGRAVYVDQPVMLADMMFFLAGPYVVPPDGYTWDAPPGPVTVSALLREQTAGVFDPLGDPYADYATKGYVDTVVDLFTLNAGDGYAWRGGRVDYTLQPGRWYQILLKRTPNAFAASRATYPTTTTFASTLAWGPADQTLEWFDPPAGVHAYTGGDGGVDTTAGHGFTVSFEGLAALGASIDEVWTGEYTQAWDLGSVILDTDGRVSLVGSVAGALSAVLVVDGVDYLTFDPAPVDGVIRTTIDLSAEGFGEHSLQLRSADASSTALSNVVRVMYPQGSVYAAADDGRNLWMPNGMRVTASLNKRVLLQFYGYSSASVTWNGLPAANYQNLGDTAGGGYVVTVDLASETWLGAVANDLEVVAVLVDGTQERFSWPVWSYSAVSGQAYGTILFPSDGDGVGAPFKARGEVFETSGLPVVLKLDGGNVPISVDATTGRWVTAADLTYAPGTQHTAELFVGDSLVASSRFQVMAGLAPGSSYDNGNLPPPVDADPEDADARSFLDWLRKPTPGGAAALAQFRAETRDVFGFIGAFWQAVPSIVRLAVWSVLILLVTFSLLKLRT